MKSGGHNTKFLVHSITSCHLPDKEACSLQNDTWEKQ